MIEQVGSIISVWTLLLLVILASVMWPRLRGAPWVPSRLATVREMLFMAGVQPGERMVSNSFTFPGLALTGKGERADVFVYTLGS